MHVVNNQETSHSFYFFEILKAIGVEGVKMQDKEVLNQNHIEEMYSKTVGKIFHGYINNPPINFITDSIQDIDKKLHCPEINKENFDSLINFAIRKNFGLIL